MALRLEEIRNSKTKSPNLNLEENSSDTRESVRPWESYNGHIKESYHNQAEDAVRRARSIVQRNNELSERLIKRALELEGRSDDYQVEISESGESHRIEKVEVSFSAESRRFVERKGITSFVKEALGI